MQLRSQSGKETKLIKSLGILISVLLELSFPNICSWGYKMTYGWEHECNNMFGIQIYHIADTRWLRKDRKCTICFFFFFFMKSFSIITFIALLGIPEVSQRLDQERMKTVSYNFLCSDLFLMVQECKCLDLFIISSGHRRPGVASGIGRPSCFWFCFCFSQICSQLT